MSDYKRDPTIVAAGRESIRRHVDFCARIARWQYRAGRGFLFERPKGTGELDEKELQSLVRLPGVKVVGVDMCEHGLRLVLTDGSKTDLVQKCTVLITNVPEIAESTARKCQRDHKPGLHLDPQR